MNTPKPIVLIRGDSRKIRAKFFDDLGAPKNITGGTVKFTVNAESAPADDDNALIVKNYSGVTLTSPSTGEQFIQLTPTDTDIEPGDYWCDVEYESGDGSEKTSAPKRKLTIQSDTTRR